MVDKNMTNNDYRQHPAVSRSDLWKMKQSPAHYKYAKENPTPKTPALVFGGASHKYILERDDFESEYAVAPELNRRTKEGKEKWAEFELENEGKEIIKAEDFDVIKDMAAAIDENEVAKALLTGEHEVSYFWTDPDTGEECKVRPDCLSEWEGKKYIVDYKTTDSCEDGHFEHSCKKYGYKFQAGMYREGVFQNEMEEYGFAFVAQEKKPPYAVRVYICTDEFINQGLDQFRIFLGLYADCKKNDNWYGYEGKYNNVTQLLGDDYE